MFDNLARLLVDDQDTVILTLSRTGDKLHVTVSQRGNPAKGIKDDRLAETLRQPVAFTGTLDELKAEFNEQLGRYIGDRLGARTRFTALSEDLAEAEADAKKRITEARGKMKPAVIEEPAASKKELQAVLI